MVVKVRYMNLSFPQSTFIGVVFVVLSFCLVGF